MTPAPACPGNRFWWMPRCTGRSPGPTPTARSQIDALTAAGARIGALNADINGNAGHVDLHATVTDLHIPGPKPDLLRRRSGRRWMSPPVWTRRTVRSPSPCIIRWFPLDGTAQTAGAQQVQAHLTLPNLPPLGRRPAEPISAAAPISTCRRSEGRHDHRRGQRPRRHHRRHGSGPCLDRRERHHRCGRLLHGQDITLSRLAVNGKALDVSAAGRPVRPDGRPGLGGWRWPTSPRSSPACRARLDAKGHAGGTADDLAVQADIGADLAAKGYQSGHITAHVDATGLPARAACH